MIIARASEPESDAEILILGLTRENIRRLTQSGEPIRIRRSTHGDGIPEGWEIIIICGDTEQTMQRDFEKHGLVGPDTKIHKDPRL